MDYQFRLSEERNELRQDERSEEHYRQLDSLLRKYNGKSDKSIKDKSVLDSDKTVKFPRQKTKKEINLFKKAKKNATP
jgi:hypothetical protein